MKNWLTTKDVASALDVTIKTVQNWCDSGILRAQKTEGGHRRVNARDVSELKKHLDLGGKVKEFSPRKDADAITEKRVLFVDDDLRMLQIYKAQLDEWDSGIDATMVNSGVEALFKLTSEHFDFIFTDIKMPDVDGSKVIKLILDENIASEEQIFVVSALDKETLDKNYLIPEGVRILDKPISFREFKKIISSGSDQADKSRSLH